MNETKSDFETVLHGAQELCAGAIVNCPPGLEAAHFVDGSPLPFALLLTWTKEAHLLMIMPAYFENIETKENLVVHLRKHIRQHRATAIALMCPVWMAQMMPSKAEYEELKDMSVEAQVERLNDWRKDHLPNDLGDHPESLEHLMIWCVSQFQTGQQICRIYRTKDAPPTLGPWGQMNNPMDDRFTGRLQQSVIAVA